MKALIRQLGGKDQRLLDEMNAEYQRSIGEVISGARSVSLLDFPRHQNAGDSLIWAGEWTALQDMKIAVDYVADIGRYSSSDLRRHSRSEVILLHGGGNFGDIWPLFQEERERVVLENPDRRIICLPQTIRFLDPQRARASNTILSRHGGVTVFARDKRSLSHARQMLPDVDVRFCIDGALANHASSSVRSPNHDVVVLQRTDKESAGAIEGLQGFEHVHSDWGLRGTARAAWALHRAPLAIQKRLPGVGRRYLHGLVQRQYPGFIRLNLSDAASKLEQGRVVVTDRLHAHVLATLKGIPNVVVDNNYGKIRPIFDEYTGRFSVARFATTKEQLRDQVGELLEQSRAREVELTS